MYTDYFLIAFRLLLTQKYILFFVINIMKRIKHYIRSRFLQLGFMNELKQLKFRKENVGGKN